MAKKVLIVDDEPNIVASLEFLMRKAGYDVAVAHDGDEALAALATFGADLVILDVMMPKRSGYEVCRQMRERPDLRHVPVMMLSARGREAEVNKGLSVGADDYVTKPFSNRELLERVAALLEEKPRDAAG